MILRRNRLAAWIGAFALMLQTLWPLLSHARPKGPSLLVPVCTIDGITHYLELKSGTQTPLDKRTATHGEHCQLCVFGNERDGTLAPQDAVLFVNSKQNSSRAIPHPVPFSQPASHSPAHPRAPPAVS